MKVVLPSIDTRLLEVTDMITRRYLLTLAGAVLAGSCSRSRAANANTAARLSSVTLAISGMT